MDKALTRYLRPATLEEYKGNTAVKSNLISNLALPGTQLPQMIMLNGRPGNGKTTLARLIAKAYLCDGKVEKQVCCETCKSCQAFNNYIKTGDATDILGLRELNCADTKGVEDIAAVAGEAYQPTFIKGWRVWVFDECHRLSHAAQSHLLKLVEEPPEKILFIFCTTDPDKVLETLLSRMNLTYTVNLEKSLIKEVLMATCKEQGVTYQAKALDYITARSQGVLRKALNNLESLLKTNTHITLDLVTELYGDLNLSLMRTLFRAYLQGNVTKFIQVLNDIEAQYSTDKLHEAALYTLKLGISIRNGVLLDDVVDEDLKAFQAIFGEYTSAELLNLFTLVLHTRKENVGYALLQAMLEKLEEPKGNMQAPVVDTKIAVKEEAKLKQEYTSEREQEATAREQAHIEQLCEVVDINSLLGD